MLTFSKLAYWHSDLYGWRHLKKEQEEWLKMAIRLCPQLQVAVSGLAHLYLGQERFDEGIALVEQAELDDPRSEAYDAILTLLKQTKVYSAREKELLGQLARNPYDVSLNLDLARLFQDEGKFPELDDKLRMIAGLTNWDHAGMADIVRYYVGTAHNTDAAIAFLEARSKIDPTTGEMIYSLATLHASVGHRDEALKYLAQAIAQGGTNAITSAKIDPRFGELRNDPAFQALLKTPPSPAVNPPTTNKPSGKVPPAALPAKK